MKTSISLAFLVALTSIGSLQAQTVWRCGEGGTIYSDRACADGRPLTVADARSSTDVAQARATAAAERSLAERMVNERLAREADMRPTAQHTPKAPKAAKPTPESLKVAGAQPRKPPKPFTVRLPKPSA